MSSIPAPVRHLILVVLAALLTGVTELLPSVNLSPAVAPFVTAAIGYALAWVTPLVQSYGVGSDPAA